MFLFLDVTAALSWLSSAPSSDYFANCLCAMLGWMLIKGKLTSCGERARVSESFIADLLSRLLDCSAKSVLSRLIDQASNDGFSFSASLQVQEVSKELRA